jgi:hypothetical protein
MEEKTPYDLALRVYDYSANEMKKRRDEIKDRVTIQQTKELFRLTNETLELAHDK